MTTISLPRLRQHIEALARFGALPGGGVTRPCWSPQHEEARAWLLARMKDTGLETRVDAAGNIFGRLGSGEAAVYTGSHIDTVPEGGILDGALGVLAGLECLQTIRESGAPHRLPLVLAAWSDEEGRYGSLFGSRAFIGRLDPTQVVEFAAVDGERLVEAMARAGFDASRAHTAAVDASTVAAYVELHIEQGPRLEAKRIPIGIVTAIVGIRRRRLTFIGQADHAGATPMPRRRDAFLAAAEYSLRARDLIVTRGSRDSVTNVGVVHVHPCVSNIVPARAELVHEMREPDPKVLERLDRDCNRLATRIARRRRLRVEVTPLSQTLPAPCAPRVQAAIARACRDLGLGTRRLHSAAGHDAQNLALITEAGMLFIPSIGGRSHRVDEMSDWRDIERGANVLLRTLLTLAA
jgi:beta-ureidopropionase / N-carbamoyl-L-amino-acid hydrolase